MFTKKEIKFLKQYADGSSDATKWVIIFVPVFLIVMGVVNLVIAAKYGVLADLELSEIFHHWRKGIDSNQQYSGVYVMAMGRMATAIMYFGGVLVLAVFVWTDLHHRRITKKVVNALKQKGVIDG